MATRYTVLYYFMTACFFNLPFIIANLVFLRCLLPESCLQSNLDSMTLGMWVQTHSFTQLVYLIGLLIATGARLCSSDAKDFLLACASALVLFNCFLMGSWLILGIFILLESQKNPEEVCPNNFQIYFLFQIIISYSGIVVTLVLCKKYFL